MDLEQFRLKPHQLPGNQRDPTGTSRWTWLYAHKWPNILVETLDAGDNRVAAQVREDMTGERATPEEKELAGHMLMLRDGSGIRFCHISGDHALDAPAWVTFIPEELELCGPLCRLLLAGGRDSDDSWTESLDLVTVRLADVVWVS